MKLTVFLLFLSFSLLQAADSYSQTASISLKVNNETVQTVLDEIEAQSEFHFFYNNKQIDTKRIISIECSDDNIFEVLDEIFIGADVEYQVMDRNIVLTLKKDQETVPPATGILQAGQQQQTEHKVTGVITDAYGEPVIGVTIVEEGSNNVSVSDLDGRYTIKTQPNANLVFSCIGFVTQTIPVNDRGVIDLLLKEDAVLLDDVVVVGFGTQVRANLTGAVSTVDTKVLEDRPLSDLNQGLQGASPGLSIIYSSGQLNGEPTINIRGTGTIIDGAASGGPLILVDGIPTSMSMVNPDDVESISVLKDAASASIYGARAAFGVVLITTKKGSDNDEIKFSYSGSVGFSNPTKLIQHMEPIQELTAIISAADARGEESESWGAYHKQTIIGVQRWYDLYADKRDPMDLNMIYGEDFENVNGTTYFYRVWDVEKLMFGRNVPNTNHSFRLSGKMGERSSIMASLGYSNRQGVMRENPEHMSRYNFTVNVNTELAKWLTADIRVMASRQDYEEPYNYMSSAGYSGFGNNGYFGHIYRYGAYAPYGTYKGVGFGFAPSYLREANLGLRRTDYLRLSAKLQAKVTKDLTVTAEYSIGQNYMNWKLNGGVLNMWRYQGAMVDPDGTPVPQGATPGSNGDAVKISNSNESTNVFNAYAKYSKRFSTDHNFSAQLGINTEWSEFQRSYSARHSLLDPTKHEIDLATGTQYSTTTSSRMAPAHTHYSIAGLFTRINYDYQGKYLVEFNARHDGSSKFPRKSQWGFFPSGSLGWRVSEESFMKPLAKIVNNMKIRISAGTIGNQRVRSNAFEAVMQGTNAYWLGNGSTTQNLTYNLPYTTSDRLTWEKVTTYDVGLDLSLFNMFDISADWFQRNTSCMLAPGETLPEVFGASAPLTNAGNLRTRGYELTLNYNKVITNNVTIFASVGFADSKSVVTSWSSAGVIDDMYEGKEIGEIWGLTSERLLQESDFSNGQMNPALPDQSGLERGVFQYGPGDVLYKDLDGDQIITGGKGTYDDHGDLTRIGNSLPRYEYNFRIGGEFYGFDLNVFFQGVGKRELSGRNSDVFMPFQRGYYDVLYAHQADYWTPQNTDAYYPRLWRYFGASNAFTGVYGSNNSIVQTRYLLNLAYLRLKNLTIGYTVPKNIVRKIKVDKIRVYMTGENLFTIQDKHLPVDPEVTQTEHMLGRSFPLQKTIAFGLQVNF